jgi:superfamily II DNA or RNA helicase
LPALRGWQKEAYAEYFRAARRDFLLVATPGAGKTAYALTVARELLSRREIMAVTIVTPTEHLKHQWSQAAQQFGIVIDSEYRNSQGRAGADFTGVAVTYAQVAAHREPAHPGDLRRDPPRRGRDVLGGRRPGGVRTRAETAGLDGNPLPFRR